MKYDVLCKQWNLVSTAFNNLTVITTRAICSLTTTLLNWGFVGDEEIKQSFNFGAACKHASHKLNSTVESLTVHVYKTR